MTSLQQNKYTARLILPLMVLLTCIAWTARFIQDDAFISFRYAENLCNGTGLVFNAGERVEGYTNFLWTLLIAAGMKSGMDPVWASQTIGLCLYPLSLGLIYLIGIDLFRKQITALFALILAGTNYTYAAYATGGLETQMQSFLFLLAFFLYRKMKTHSPALNASLLSIVLGLAFLLRMDSAILIGSLLVAGVHSIFKTTLAPRKKILALAALTLPAALLAGTWLGWKLSYYGQVLPNTYATKNPGLSGVVPGLFYLVLFVVSYGMFLLAIPALRIFRKRIPIPRPLIFPMVISGFWFAYIVKVGGGFMEFRFMVPIIPFLALVAAWLISSAFQSGWSHVGWIILLALVSLFHSTRTRLYGVETIKGLQAHVLDEKWITAGKSLHTLFNNDSSVSIATTAAGAIPYYSQLPTVDILGLNDKWIAANGVSTRDPKRKWLGAKPGHQRKATLDYLCARRVNLLIGHPRIINCHADLSTLSINDFAKGDYLTLNPAPFPEHARLLCIPVDETSVLIAVYLTPSPSVEKAIAEGRISEL
ncbi:MAG: hypothetical protein JXR25_10870 [Pontiellaceae bacterium]|nr:hypothetical protein [Pontiellaceae bacterium]MBN2785322.1 hypothetical protein [Pontiellaceae bacterium]